MFWNIDLRNGVVTYDDISFLSDNFNIEESIDFLKEDLLQIEFPNDFLLDVGWRPSFDENGCFHLSLIKSQNWEKPVYTSQTKLVQELKDKISYLSNNLVNLPLV